MPYDKPTRTFTFPDVVPIHRLSPGTFAFNDIDGGFIPIKDIGKKTSEFLGGNVDQLGFAKKYGFYLCPMAGDFDASGEPQHIMAIYVTDGKMVTPAGRDLIRKCFTESHVIVFGDEHEQSEEDEAKARATSAVEQAKRVAARAEAEKAAIEVGFALMELKGLSTTEIEELVRARLSGKNEEIKAGTTEGTGRLIEENQRIVNKHTPAKRKAPVKRRNLPEGV